MQCQGTPHPRDTNTLLRYQHWTVEPYPSIFHLLPPYHWSVRKQAGDALHRTKRLRNPICPNYKVPQDVRFDQKILGQRSVIAKLQKWLPVYSFHRYDIKKVSRHEILKYFWSMVLASCDWRHHFVSKEQKHCRAPCARLTMDESKVHRYLSKAWHTIQKRMCTPCTIQLSGKSIIIEVPVVS